LRNIPIRLTAVAANPNMTVLTWIFADGQTTPTNYAHPRIKDEDIRGSLLSVGGTNYLQLVDDTIDLYEGRAFITEYAMPTSELRDMRPNDQLINLLAEKYNYVTRHFGRISPEEMTVDPVFKVDEDMPDVTNIHDLSEMDAEVFWGCEGTEPPVVEFDENAVPDDFE